MDETTYNETRDELCLFLNECKIEKVIKGSLSQLMKSLDFPYYNVIPSILNENNIMSLQKQGRNAVWEWTSKVDPSRDMADRILLTAKKKQSLKVKYSPTTQNTKNNLTADEQAVDECLESVFGPDKTSKKPSVEDKVTNKILEVSNKLNKLTKELDTLEKEKASLHFYLTELQSLLEE